MQPGEGETCVPGPAGGGAAGEKGPHVRKGALSTLPLRAPGAGTEPVSGAVHEASLGGARQVTAMG